MSKVDFAETFKSRTKMFAIEVVKLCRKLPNTEESRIIGRQLLRSATSVAANYRAVCRARSDNEFYSKPSIVVEEADECLFWMEVLEESGIYEVDVNLIKEAQEILAIVSSSRKTMKTGRQK